MENHMLMRRVAAGLLAIVGVGVTLYAGWFTLWLVPDPIVTWSQRLAAITVSLGIGAAVLAGVRALLGLKVVSWWLALPPAILALVFGMLLLPIHGP